jgi:hypothetical protein
MTPADPVTKLFDPRNAFFQVGRLHFMPSIAPCCICIIHDFFTCFAQSHPATVFCFSMTFPTLLGPPIPSLSLSMLFPFRRVPACLAAISLTSPTPAANAKTHAAQPALDFQ